jgi:hypothetical protein
MITFFTTGKPFRGHDGLIQRNALKSWKLLHPDVEVIVFGDEEGAAEVCAELTLRHEPQVERYQAKLPYISSMFARAQQIARHEYLCYANCDIILFKDFLRAFEIAREWRKTFLSVGRRWDTDVTEILDFDRSGWDEGLRELALSRGQQMDEYWIDFFLFGKGLYKDMPPLVVGHCYWDNWMIWKALSLRAAVIDFTSAVITVHQNHGYNPEHGRVKGTATDALSLRNLNLIGGIKHTGTVKSATHRIGKDGRLRRNLGRYLPLMPAWLRQIHRFLVYDAWLPSWHFILGITRPVRSALKLRSKHDEKLRQ